MHSRALLATGSCLLAVLVALAISPSRSMAATQTAADPSDVQDGASGRADLRSVTWDVGPTSAVLGVSLDASTFVGGRALVALDIFLDTDADGIADRDIAAARNPDGLRIDLSLRVLDHVLSTADCQDLAGATTSAQATVATTLAGGLETFAFAFDPRVVPGALTTFRWAIFGRAPPPPAAGGPWDVMPDAANPTPGAPNPSDRRCGPGLGGLRVRLADGVAFPDPVVPPAPQPPVAAPLQPVTIAPPAVAASFATAPKSLLVSRTGSFTYSFLATPGASGKISLRSARRVRVGATQRFVRLAARTFTASSTGTVRLRLTLSGANLRLLRHAGRLRFTVTVVVSGKTFTTGLTLRAPKRR